MAKLTDNLLALFSRFLAKQSAEFRENCGTVNSKRVRDLQRLRKLGIETVSELLARLPGFSPGLKQSAIHFTWLLKIRQAVPVLVEMLPDRKTRWLCADTISWLRPGRKTTEIFLRIGARELQSPTPDRHWLWAVIYGLQQCSELRAAEMLVTIFERTDLPGSLRGEVGDKLGWVRDRRTRIFRRCREAALRGLHDESLDVQFWSMYVIMCLAGHDAERGLSPQNGFACALPRLREIAANDHRLAPGFWWPLSAEAEDTIASIEGSYLDPDAGERWLGNTQRGEWKRS